MHPQVPVQRHSVRTAGSDTSYLEAGPADGPVALFIHGAGIGMGAHSWFPTIEPLAVRMRCLAIDLIGYGDSTKVVYYDRSATAQRLEQLRTFCEALAIEEATFVGHSMGGGLVLAGAIARTLPATALVSLAGPGGILLDRARMASGQTDDPDEAWARAACEVGVPDPSEAMIAQRLDKARDPQHLAVMAAQRTLNQLHPRGEGYEARYLESLRSIEQPTLLVGGSDDPYADPSWPEVLGAELSDVQTLMVTGARHEPQTSHPDIVLPAIERLAARAVAVT